MNKRTISIIGLSLVIMSVGCQERKTVKKSLSGIDTVAVVEEIPTVKDSIDVLIEERAEQEFTSTIFAGLRFGNSKQAVESAMKDVNKKKIRVIVGEEVRQIIIRAHDADYYNGQLASLTLYADETHLIDALDSLYSSKYGKTKQRLWVYKDAEVSIEIRTRGVYKAGDEWNPTTLYYNSYRGSNTTAITTIPTFLAINYKSYPRIQLIQRQKAIKDSLENAKRVKEEQQQKERERKLAEKAASNI